MIRSLITFFRAGSNDFFPIKLALVFLLILCKGIGHSPPSAENSDLGLLGRILAS
jgi:hypothetical protein